MPSPLTTISTKLHTAGTLIGAGIVRPMRPDKIVRTGLLMARWGPTAAAGYAAAAMIHPDRTAMIDELGALTFAEVHERTNALAHAFSDAGVGEGDGVAILCRNHRGFLEATIACSKLGATALYLNTSFAGPQIADVCEREQPVALVFDEEFAGLVGNSAKGRTSFVAWRESDDPGTDDSLEHLIEVGDTSPVVPPAEPGKAVILTSGTTGTPKGASRAQPKSLDPAAALLSMIPLHARETTMIACPLFHSWGFAHFTLGLALGSTVVLRRRFDPEQTLAATAEHRATALIVVPVMLQRILELDEEVRNRYDLRGLRVIAVSGSQLPGALATAAMDAFGDTVYNLYGSTEVAWATIATPEDMRAAPGTAGRPPRGTIVKIYDDDGRELPAEQTGRIFVGNEMLFEGYTGGGSKDEINGLMATGDVGHFDRGGRLHVDGRDDEMIVSGGENVFPQEVEQSLAEHPAIAEAAVIGVEDEKFGQRLKAFVVACKGTQVEESELKRHVKDNLANFKVPREFVFMDELPRNPTGKVLKRELK
ncbi:MAG TPA: acyl-CoA synthetase [Solirubrobacteraceae bacterium]|nr:acyl-CoA synthetase [Solirubrobacteraceae bacterium]